MLSEFRKITDDEIKEVFFQTKKTHNAIVEKVEYIHQDLFPDFYKVYTSEGTYQYQSTTKNMRDYRKGCPHYDRIVKMK